MKKIFLVFSMLLLFTSFTLGQSDPTVKIMTVPSVMGETVNVPLSAKNFSNVGAFTLEIQFDADQLEFLGTANASADINNGDLNTIFDYQQRKSVDGTDALTSVVIIWGYDPDDASTILETGAAFEHIFDLQFTHIDGLPAPITGLTVGTPGSFTEDPSVNATPITFIDGMATGPGVIITDPNGGETWNIGAVETIEWLAAGTAVLDAELSTDNGDTWTSIASGIDATAMMYDFTVVSDPTDQALVRLTATDIDTPYDVDVSDDVFNIYDLGANPHTITIGTVSGEESDTVGVPVYGSNFIDVAAFTVEIIYDPACVTPIIPFDGTTDLDESRMYPPLLVGNAYYEANAVEIGGVGYLTVIWNYDVDQGIGVELLSISNEPAKLFEVDFIKNTADECPIELGVGTLVEDEEAQVLPEGKLVNGGINTAIVKLATVKGQAVASGATVVLPVTTKHLKDVLNFDFELGAQSDELTFVSATEVNDVLTSNGELTVTDDAGTLSIVYVGTTPFDFADGVLFNLVYTFDSGFTSSIVFNDASMSDSNGDPIYLNTWDGGVNISPLPVELSLFESSVSGNTVTLNWITATETNNYGFEIERAAEKGAFQTIGFIAGHGNSSSPKAYQFTDEVEGASLYLYRLKQIDIGGSFKYSAAIEVNISGIPMEYTLNQNYPNPFNPATTIGFQLPEAGSVKLSVYNLLGQEVAVLADGFMEAGYHNINFTANNLSTGIYLYRIEAGNFVQIKKMTLLK